jgi:hypothetical protein
MIDVKILGRGRLCIIIHKVENDNFLPKCIEKEINKRISIFFHPSKDIG